MSELSAVVLPVAGDSAILAHRYVGALFALAEQKGAVDTIVSDMVNLRSLWNESSEWRFIASDPRLSAETVGKATEKVSSIAKFSKLTANFLSILAQNRRLSLLPLLIENFIEDVRTRRGEFRADVRIARPLSDDQREKLTSLLAAAVNGKIRLAVTEDASIIGGLTVKVGSKFIDASVKTKLDLLERTLKGANAAA